jgi:hypothetical protein
MKHYILPLILSITSGLLSVVSFITFIGDQTRILVLISSILYIINCVIWGVLAYKERKWE